MKSVNKKVIMFVKLIGIIAGTVAIASYGINSYNEPSSYIKKGLNATIEWFLPMNSGDSEENYVSSKMILFDADKFSTFASVEYRNQLYMTPQDFLESMLDPKPRFRSGRDIWNDCDWELFFNKTLNSNIFLHSKRLFEVLNENGLISYLEYVFLKSFVTRSDRELKLAYHVVSKDQSLDVDKNDFFNLLQEISTSNLNISDISNPLSENYRSILYKFLGIIIDTKGKQCKIDPKSLAVQYIDLNESKLTTLTILFFGKDGDHKLSYANFHSFIRNLENEILELEFFNISKSMPTITIKEFLSLIPPQSAPNMKEYRQLLERPSKSLQWFLEKEITFRQFKFFAQFLYNLEDFYFTLDNLNSNNIVITKKRFSIVSKLCSGRILEPNIVDTMFYLFNSNNGKGINLRAFYLTLRKRLTEKLNFMYVTPQLCV